MRKPLQYLIFRPYLLSKQHERARKICNYVNKHLFAQPIATNRSTLSRTAGMQFRSNAKNGRKKAALSIRRRGKRLDSEGIPPCVNRRNGGIKSMKKHKPLLPGEETVCAR